MKTPSAKGTVVSSTGWAASLKGDGGTLWCPVKGQEEEKVKCCYSHLKIRINFYHNLD